MFHENITLSFIFKRNWSHNLTYRGHNVISDRLVILFFTFLITNQIFTRSWIRKLENSTGDDVVVSGRWWRRNKLRSELARFSGSESVQYATWIFMNSLAEDYFRSIGATSGWHILASRRYAALISMPDAAARIPRISYSIAHEDIPWWGPKYEAVLCRCSSVQVAMAKDTVNRNLTWRGGEETLLPDKVAVNVGKCAVNMLWYDTSLLFEALDLEEDWVSYIKRESENGEKVWVPP